MTREDCRARLLAMAEEKYRCFSASLLPGVGEIRGVRLPALRKLAARMLRDEEWEEWLTAYFSEEERWFEEDMLAGFLTAGAKISPQDRMERIHRFLPRVTNWSVCDSFCASLWEAARMREFYWPFVVECLKSGGEFPARAGAVLLLDHYRAPEWTERALEALRTAVLPGYYAEMAAGWAVSLFYLDSREQTRPYLAEGVLPAEVRRIALRKIRESRRCLPEERQQFAAERRKGR